ncbi:aminodeoxychorismate synthase component I [Planococcus sp. CP5-4]|uniref:aminodeoxychorismate synthase component I n=1 Tax=unclassified Planococcus (in: firmicutes) TaxID=2662419 RepID=UPI001C2326A9|nr:MULTISPECIES: aminodeoxychorismate synthase component I [unclassified Planococcus (in: firmicutes)]MBU9671883.1 aminodeoxychorismate synthase component I [Planococcus sp. CP5-4_YE]MBV0909203.1 aminodeoxychorismate synthase component I [Planococcus sp. CP5-4_UN]MBW6063695.1 aminodeoxychorismate synthase component I [Planococcus sp. CP5-4]
MMAPYLQFDFVKDDGMPETVAFSEPYAVLEAKSLEDVAIVFEQVDRYTSRGYYAAGYVSYEAAPAFHTEMAVHEGAEMPLVWFGIYSDKQAPKPAQAAHYEVSDWMLEGSIPEYKEGIHRIRQAIEEGNTYQVNYTERLTAGFKGDAKAFYRQLARNQQADYSAYLDIGRHQILSASPELFFRIDGSRIRTKPMKGTAPRGRTNWEDESILDVLLESEKERAENLMIVDLLRNDMSRLAKPGTVKVPKLFEAEKYPTVHQLTSTVEGELLDGLSIFDWFQALFPCGSITGAPKVSTMRYIAGLEQTPREVYCGAIGYITPEKNAVFNVPIRTVVIDQDKSAARYGVGGGITWDSTSEGEYEELLTKARVLTDQRPEFALLESLKLEDGNYPLVALHLARLKKSAAYFRFALDEETLAKQLELLASKHATGLFKVRLTLERNGKLELIAQPAVPIEQPIRCALAKVPVDSRNAFFYHKTTNRGIYEQHQQHAPDAFSVLLWNDREELTEFTIGNLVAEKDGRYYTPPVSSGLLAGTYREQLIEEGRIESKVLKKDELNTFDAIWFINSVRGWMKVELDDINS